MSSILQISIAILGIVLLAPLWLVLIGLIKLETRGPAVYKSERIGRGGHPFTIYKLRTMKVIDGRSSSGITAAGDDRITRVGRVLRRLKLDETLQLINVVKGEMALVGPRPEDRRYVELYNARQRRVLDVRPGIMGPAALEFIDEEQVLAEVDDPETYYVEKLLPAKLELELAYLDQRTTITDLGLIAHVVVAVFRRERVQGNG